MSTSGGLNLWGLWRRQVIRNVREKRVFGQAERSREMCCVGSMKPLCGRCRGEGFELLRKRLFQKTQQRRFLLLPSHRQVHMRSRGPRKIVRGPRCPNYPLVAIIWPSAQAISLSGQPQSSDLFEASIYFVDWTKQISRKWDAEVKAL